MDKTLKICDLSEAILNIDQWQTLTSFYKIGTPMTISPELVNHSEYDSWTDVWSLGVTLYYLTCFKLPYNIDFKRQTTSQLLAMISGQK